MFTGLVEATGSVISLQEQGAAWRLILKVPFAGELALGDSVACNGCCLTVVDRQGDRVHFDLLEETLRLTSFLGLRTGAKVNLERSLRADARMGGHFVTGHVDDVGTLRVFEPRGKNVFLEVAFNPAFAKWVVYKGSIAIEGISLTVAEVSSDSLSVWLIPHTLAVTHLHTLQAGQKVNLEFDLLAKYAEKILCGKRE